MPRWPVRGHVAKRSRARGGLGVRFLAQSRRGLGGVGRCIAAEARRCGVEQGGGSVGAHAPLALGDAPGRYRHRHSRVASEGRAAGTGQTGEIRGVLASLCDGAGAQSLFALAKQGRRFALACLLVKSEVGVQDAWVRDGMTKAEADDLIAQIVAGAEAVEISIGLLEQRLADALAINVARDVPPPFGLLQVAETLALGPLHPESISPPALVEALIGDLPPGRKDTKAVLAAHRASARWEQEFETVTSWFEPGEAVEGLLRPLRTRKRRIEAVSAQLLPARRSFWGERCAWMAATLKESAEDGDNAWSDFALVARDLLGERPLDAIPLATRIASATVEAFEQR